MKRKRSGTSKQKWYAVRVGRIPGIYLTWEQCQEQVSQYHDASYKRFSTEEEAVQWFNAKRFHIATITLNPLIYVYTDGSHNRVTNSKGYGIYVSHHSCNYGLSIQMTDDVLVHIFNVAKDDAALYFPFLSNPTLELAAAVHVLHLWATSTHFPYDLCICSDYLGVECWLTNKWKAKKPYIQHLVTHGQQSIKTLMNSRRKVSFCHVKGHSGVKGNEMADCLASGKPVTCRPFLALFSSK